MPSRLIRLKAIALMDRGIDALEQSPVQGLDRRAFFKASASTLALAWLAACDSSGPDSAEKVLAYATRKNESIEAWLLRHTSMNHGSPGAATAGDRFPSYFVSDTVPMYDVRVGARRRRHGQSTAQAAAERSDGDAAHRAAGRPLLRRRLDRGGNVCWRVDA